METVTPNRVLAMILILLYDGFSGENFDNAEKDQHIINNMGNPAVKEH